MWKTTKVIDSLVFCLKIFHNYTWNLHTYWFCSFWKTMQGTIVITPDWLKKLSLSFECFLAFFRALLWFVFVTCGLSPQLYQLLNKILFFFYVLNHSSRRTNWSDVVCWHLHFGVIHENIFCSADPDKNEKPQELAKNLFPAKSTPFRVCDSQRLFHPFLPQNLCHCSKFLTERC